ncbi:nucleoside-diphosphate sugar epimerase [Gammaproteobacteria bacterium SCGC AG-212-F23]|nr:nucleoside-diphosphate sugar epimerase [Gammaproteobacteria bacterium SCGC AG-212-F23]
MQKRILVTGGAGFIGSHLVDLLVAKNRAVTVLDDFSVGKKSYLQSAEQSGDVKIIEGSILDFDSIELAMQDCDIVFHLAVECVRRSLNLPLQNHHTNATGTINMLEVARKHKIKRFIYCSSSEVYGNGKDKLLNETSTLCEPMTVYGAAKLAGEYYAKAYYRTYQLPTTIVRPFNAYGPRAYEQGIRAEVIPRFIIRLLNDLPPVIFGNGACARDFTHVTEVAHGLTLAAHCDALIGKEVNIAFGKAYTMQEVAVLLAKLCGKPHIKPMFVDPRPGDVHFLHADTHLASQVLKFKPEIGFEQGLQDYLSWFQQSHTDVSVLLEKDILNWQTEKV